MHLGNAFATQRPLNVLPPLSPKLPPNRVNSVGFTTKEDNMAVIKPNVQSNISINILPHTIPFDSDNNTPSQVTCVSSSSSYPEPINMYSTPNDPTFVFRPIDQASMLSDCLLFNSNITSLSVEAKDYLFALPNEVKYLTLNEIHKTDKTEVEDMFKSKGFTASFNPSQLTSKGGTHGGEIVACRSHIQSNSIKPQILDNISSLVDSPLHFSARILKLHKLQVLLVAVYLWTSEGFSDRNNNGLFSTLYLKEILKLPI